MSKLKLIKDKGKKLEQYTITKGDQIYNFEALDNEIGFNENTIRGCGELLKTVSDVKSKERINNTIKTYQKRNAWLKEMINEAKDEFNLDPKLNNC